MLKGDLLKISFSFFKLCFNVSIALFKKKDVKKSQTHLEMLSV